MGDRKFKSEELKVKGIYPYVGTNYGYPFSDIEILSTPITPKENFKLFMERKEFYWVPNLSTDFNAIFPEIVPDCKAVGFEGGIDSFGVEWIPVEDNTNLPAFVKPGNPKLKKITEWTSLDFPNVDSWDWEGSKKLYEKAMLPDRVNYSFIPNSHFERLVALMDFANAAMALIEDPAAVQAFFEKLTDYNISLLEHYKKYFDIDLVWVSDDWGSQRAPLFSRKTVRELIVPHYKRLVDRAHELGIYVMTHCCGNAEGFLPEMIEIGTDIWQPQIECNPDLFKNIEKYGDKIFFNSYAIFEDIEDIDEFRKVNMERCKKYLANKRFFIQFESWSSNSNEKNKIAYELLRKTATDEPS